MISMKVFTLSILLMTILLKETISYNRKLTNIYRHHRNNFHPLYRTEVLDPEECAEEQCERDTIPHVHETPSDLALNEDFNELWPETIGNDLNKRGSSKVVNNYDSTDSECKHLIASFKKGTLHTKSLQETHTSSDAVCSCGIKWKSLILGRNHYPSYITEAYCEPPCRLPSSTCTDKFIVVHVLKKRNDEPIFQNEFDPLLSIEMQKNFLYERITMPIECDCS